MPATYTYNNAVEEAKRVVMKAWDEVFEIPANSAQMKLMLTIIGRLDALKRPSRRKRKPAFLEEK